MKQLAFLEACKELHNVSALTDNLVPDIMEEEVIITELGNSNIFYLLLFFGSWLLISKILYCAKIQFHTIEKSKYFPPELVSHCGSDSEQCTTTT